MSARYRTAAPDRAVRHVVATLVAGVLLAACTSAPTPIPATPTASAGAAQRLVVSPHPTPTSSPLPGWVVDALKRWLPDSANARSLVSPDVPYLIGGSANGRPNGITYTPALARRWWDDWFERPVNIAGVAPNLLPGNLVLSQNELKQAQALMGVGSTLPKAPPDYNPLGLPVIP